MPKRNEVEEVARRPYWREADGRVIVHAWKESGDTLSAFASRLGVDPKRVSRWSARLERRKPTAMRFHPVRLIDGVSRGRDGGIEIELGEGRLVRVAAGFDPNDLKRVLAVLGEGTPC